MRQLHRLGAAARFDRPQIRWLGEARMPEEDPRPARAETGMGVHSRSRRQRFDGAGSRVEQLDMAL